MHIPLLPSCRIKILFSISLFILQADSSNSILHCTKMKQTNYHHKSYECIIYPNVCQYMKLVVRIFIDEINNDLCTVIFCVRSKLKFCSIFSYLFLE